MSLYTKQHYEDIAKLIRDSWPEAVPEDINEVILFSLANKFADLFATDNPKRCDACGSSMGTSTQCPYNKDHLFEGGFDREQFLTACGLEPARPYSTSMFRPANDE